MIVYKYILPVEDSPRVRMPQGARILTAAEQRGEVCVWALVNPDLPTVTRQFRVAGTGHPDVPGDGIYVGSAHLMGGALVFHVFDLGVRDFQ